MSTVTTKRKRISRRKTDDKIGAEAWQIIGPNGEVLRETGFGAEVALVLAQALALYYDKETELTVQLRPLFGEPDVLYRIVRDEDGAVLTHRQ